MGKAYDKVPVQKYRRLITGMRDAAGLALRTDEDRDLVSRLCGLKLSEAADEFERLLQWLAKMGDDGR